MTRGWMIFVVTSADFFLSQFYRATNAVIADDLVRDPFLDTAGLGTLGAAFFTMIGPAFFLTFSLVNALC